LSINKTLFCFIAVTAVAVVNFSQTSSNPNSTPPSTSLTASQKLLVSESRKAIIETGITEAYFDAHFKLLEVNDKPADKRVNWEFSINGYRTIVRDSIGSSMQGNTHVNIHSVVSMLGQTSEITKTLSRSRALKILRTCIGPYTTPSIQYGPVNGQAQLLLVAHAVSRDSDNKREREMEREKEKREIAKATSQGSDVIETEDEDHRTKSVFGTVNLQTGQCTKGYTQVAP
jgi:hypothetical protein